MNITTIYVFNWLNAFGKEDCNVVNVGGHTMMAIPNMTFWVRTTRASVIRSTAKDWETKQYRVRVIVFNATFNNMSAISWQ